MKNSVILASAAVILSAHQTAQAAMLECPSAKAQMARCSLIEMRESGGMPTYSPFPVEGIFCAVDGQPGRANFVFRVGDEAPFSHEFTAANSAEDQYRSVNPSVSAELYIDEANGQIKISESVLGKTVTSLFSCLLW
ncbi:MAG: hypothetical protein IPJ84_05215 [Bdellovibrionales bacterium]|nr:hypothetical protein [Bdellovibrionales bacterium]